MYYFLMFLKVFVSHVLKHLDKQVKNDKQEWTKENIQIQRISERKLGGKFRKCHFALI